MDNTQPKSNSKKNSKKSKGKTGAGRPRKEIAYKTEREGVIDELNIILGITETNNIFYLSLIDDDAAKQRQILDLEAKIKLYFNYSHWPFFSKDIKKRKCLSLIKSIYKDMHYTMTPILKAVMINNKKHHRTGYIVEKNILK